MLWLFISAFLVYVFWSIRHDQKIERRAEAIQEPSLNTDADWTLLDELAIDIARHESLARWYAQGRPLFRDTPVVDRNVEGGWEFFCDEWGDDIPENYEKIFYKIRGMRPGERARLLKIAEKQSASARASCNAYPIILPDQSKASLPSWMQITPEEAARVAKRSMA